jgi:glycosyltransferase involved in cell wall biosynthesis
MRILHVYSGNLYGGIEAILRTLALSAGAAASASEPMEHAYALCFEGRLSRELEQAGAEVHRLGEVRLSRPHTLVRARGVLARVLARGGFDRVICHAPWPQGLLGPVAQGAGVPLVFWAHDAMTGRHWTERLARRVVPDAAICNSAFTASTMGALYPDLGAEVLYAPVATSGPASAAARRRVRASLDTPESAVVIVTACRSEAWKGHDVLVDALGLLRDVPGWIWWQVGGAQRASESAWLAQVRDRAAARGVNDRVRWLGQRDDVPQLLLAADLYCQPNSRPEPFGVVLVEALGAGLPVVTSDLGGAPEIVDASCGVLVPAGDARLVARALDRLIANPDERARKGAAGPARARAISDPATQIRKMERLLVDVASEVGA